MSGLLAKPHTPLWMTRTPKPALELAAAAEAAATTAPPPGPRSRRPPRCGSRTVTLSSMIAGEADVARRSSRPPSPRASAMSDSPLNFDSSSALGRLRDQIGHQIAGRDRHAGGGQRLDEITSCECHAQASYTAGETEVMVKSSIRIGRHERRAGIVVGLARVHRHRRARSSRCC